MIPVHIPANVSIWGNICCAGLHTGGGSFVFVFWFFFSCQEKITYISHEADENRKKGWGHKKPSLEPDLFLSFQHISLTI